MTEWSDVLKPSWFTKLTSLDILNTGGSSPTGVLPGKALSTDVGSVGQGFEITVTQESAVGGATNCSAIGLANSLTDLSNAFDGVTGIGWHSDGWFITAAGAISTGVGWDDGDVLGVEWFAANDVRFYKNGTLAYTYTGDLPDGDLYAAAYLLKNPNEVVANFGATTFAHLTGVSAWSGGASGPASAVVAQFIPPLVQLAEILSGSGAPPPPVVGTGGFFPDSVALYLAGRNVRADFLVFFDFATTPKWLWQGFGTLKTLDDNEWEGIGALGRVGDIESAIGGTAPSVTFTLSGVDPDLIADALASGDEVFGRPVKVYIQLFDDDWACTDNPYCVWSGIMDTMKVMQSGTDTCTVELNAESPFARRALAPLGNMTDREQQILFPGDKGLSLTPTLMSKQVAWPVIQPGYP